MLKVIALTTLALALGAPTEASHDINLRLILIWSGVALLALLPESIFEDMPGGRRAKVKALVPSCMMAVAVTALIHYTYQSELVSFATCVLVAIFGERLVDYIISLDGRHKIMERFLSGLLSKVFRVKMYPDYESNEQDHFKQADQPLPPIPPIAPDLPSGREDPSELDDTYFIGVDNAPK